MERERENSNNKMAVAGLEIRTCDAHHKQPMGLHDCISGVPAASSSRRQSNAEYQAQRERQLSTETNKKIPNDKVSFVTGSNCHPVTAGARGCLCLSLPSRDFKPTRLGEV